MTPILGILASGISGNLWQPGKDYDSIATITPYTTTSTVVFSSIPSTYTHLQLRASAAGSSAANMTFRFNGDTSINYSYHYISANGASVVAGGSGGGTYALGPVVTNTASSYTGIIVDILDYKNTNKNKTLRTLAGADLNGASNWLEFSSGAWFSTTAINSITITLGGGTFAANSHWALYGIK
jgi:hypothetical protein